MATWRDGDRTSDQFDIPAVLSYKKGHEAEHVCKA